MTNEKNTQNNHLDSHRPTQTFNYVNEAVKKEFSQIESVTHVDDTNKPKVTFDYVNNAVKEEFGNVHKKKGLR